MHPSTTTIFPITILSWNVLSTRAYNKYNKPQPKSFHTARWKSILVTVKTHRPHVLLLQEVDSAFLEWFVQRLQTSTARSWRSVHLSTVADDYQPSDFGSCVVYDERLAPVRVGMLRNRDKYWAKDAAYIICKQSKQKCFICSLHLPGTNRDAGTRLVQDALRASKGCAYKIISGDFNRDMSGVSHLNGFVNRLKHQHPHSKQTLRSHPTTCDFDYTTQPKPAQAEIDKCLLSPNLQFVTRTKSSPLTLPYTVHRKRTCKQYRNKKKVAFVRVVGSDHFPLVARIRIRNI